MFLPDSFSKKLQNHMLASPRGLVPVPAEDPESAPGIHAYLQTSMLIILCTAYAFCLPFIVMFCQSIVPYHIILFLCILITSHGAT